MSAAIIDKFVRLLTLTTLAVFVFYGLTITIFPLFPLWIDEWLIIDNLKFKPPQQLWHVLDHTQQFPRVYLQCVKAFCAACDYSYASLRLPAFLAHCFGLALLYSLSRRLFSERQLARFAWILIYVAFNTSIHYFVLLKQYTMEMALSLAGIWQLLELVRIERQKPPWAAYLLLCFSLGICPFFSYTYPIVIAPVYLIAGLRAIRIRRLGLITVVPLLIGILSVAAVYIIDVRHVLADGGMQDYWSGQMMRTFSLKVFVAGIYCMFANLGAGDLFGNIFGVLGIAAFLFSAYKAARISLNTSSEADILTQYSSLLVLTAISLFVAGKLPLGEFRLNSFIVPAIGFMLIETLAQLMNVSKWRLPSVGILLFLTAVSAGNVFVTMAEVLSPQHRKKVRIFGASGTALRKARHEGLPIFVTPAIAYPYDGTQIADWVLKTNPDFKVYEPVPVYLLLDAACAQERMDSMPAPIHSAIILDGDSVREIHSDNVR